MIQILKKRYPKIEDAALLFARVIIAAIFLYAGYSKLVFWSAPGEGISESMLYLIKFLSIVEPLGALAILLGILTRLAAAGLALIMVGAIITLRFTADTSFFTLPQATGLDYNTLILSGCLILLAFGAGRWSLDAARK